MTLHRIQISAVAVVFAIFFLASNLARTTVTDAAVPGTITITAAPAANWTFSGCWTQFSSRPCSDIFVDPEGNHWICKECGTTGKPGPGKCNPISTATLASGFWCS
jgi:hypothetical protein